MVQEGDRTQFGRVCIIRTDMAGWTCVWVELHDGSLPLLRFREHPTLRQVQEALGDPEVQDVIGGEVVVKHVRALPPDGGIPLESGGHTVVMTRGYDGTVQVALAMCKAGDVFDEELGQRLAQNRLRPGGQYRVDLPPEVGSAQEATDAAIDALLQSPAAALVEEHLAEVGA